MTRLVSDVGGTNSRLALSVGGTLLTDTIRSFGNDGFATFEDVAAHYLNSFDTPAPDIAELVVAVAGPVQGQRAQLTNRNWLLDGPALSDRFNGAGIGLLNDLKALGNALPHLSGATLRPVVKAPVISRGLPQSLVIGVGTGFNVSPAITTPGGVLCPDSEMGHTHTPYCVHRALRRDLGPVADQFDTVEAVFSGRGFARLFAAYSGREGWGPERILTAQADAVAQDFTRFYAALLAHLARDLLLAFLPTSGIYFAGSVARNVLLHAQGAFAEVYQQPHALDPDLSAPVFVIEDDAAALKGCANYAVS